MNTTTIIITGIIIFTLFFIVLTNKKTKRKSEKNEFYKEQEQRVKIGGYKKQPLLNNTEDISRAAIIKALTNTNKRLYAQVSLGEILQHDNYKLYKDIQSKRADFVITDNKNIPICVIEIHGNGHYQNKNTTKRDEIKKLALEDAGIKYIAIAVGNNPKQIYAQVINKVKEFIK